MPYFPVYVAISVSEFSKLSEELFSNVIRWVYNHNIFRILTEQLNS